MTSIIEKCKAVESVLILILILVFILMFVVMIVDNKEEMTKCDSKENSKENSKVNHYYSAGPIVNGPKHQLFKINNHAIESWFLCNKLQNKPLKVITMTTVRGFTFIVAESTKGKNQNYKE